MEAERAVVLDRELRGAGRLWKPEKPRKWILP